MQLKNCNLCPLSKDLPCGVGPCKPIMTQSDTMIVSFQPSYDDTLLGIENSIEYDIIKKATNTPFYLTHLVKCPTLPTLKPSKMIVNTCMLAWLQKEITKLQPKQIFTLGKDVSYHLINQVKMSHSMKVIVGRKFIQDDIVYTPNFSPASMINSGRVKLKEFARIFNE